MKKPTKPLTKASANPPATPDQSAAKAAPSNPKPSDAMLRQAMANKINIGFAQFVTLMMRQQSHRTSFIAELEWSLVPPVSLQQFLITEVQDSSQGIPIAVAGVLWARVSKEVNDRLMKTPGRIKLAPAEWASGDIPWLVEAVGEKKYVSMLIKHLAEKVFVKQGLRAIERAADGKVQVRILGGASETPKAGAVTN